MTCPQKSWDRFFISELNTRNSNIVIGVFIVVYSHIINIYFNQLIFIFMHHGLHVTTNFLVIKRWMEARSAIPAAVTVDEKRIPAVAFGDVDCPGWEEVAWGEFFDLMAEEELAFAFEEDREDDMVSAHYFKFVPWEKYPDEIKMEEEKADKIIIAQTAFS
jgi:hypothetical protein